MLSLAVVLLPCIGEAPQPGAVPPVIREHNATAHAGHRRLQWKAATSAVAAVLKRPGHAKSNGKGAETYCPHLAPTPGPAARRDLLEFCAALMRAHKLGLSKRSLLVDVGTDQATEARTARGFGHPVLTFECRGQVAERHRSVRAIYNDSGLRLVHACVAERPGLGTLVRAMDSSSMSAQYASDAGADWKRRREARTGAATESVAVLPLDAALEDASLRALEWPELVGQRVGFI
jgi:hypothetical protein